MVEPWRTGSERCLIAWLTAVETGSDFADGPETISQAEAGGTHIDEGVGCLGKSRGIVGSDEHLVALDHDTESERGHSLDFDLFEWPRTQAVGTGPNTQTLICDLDVDRKTFGRVSLMLDTSFEFADDAPPGHRILPLRWMSVEVLGNNCARRAIGFQITAFEADKDREDEACEEIESSVYLPMHEVQEEAGDHHPGAARVPMPGVRHRVALV